MEDRQNKIAIYRAVFANYDTILDELVVVPNADYFLFTDDPDLRIYPYKLFASKEILINPPSQQNF